MLQRTPSRTGPTPDHLEQLSAGLQHLSAAYPRQEVPPETIAVYLEDLQEAPLELAIDAMANLRRCSRFFPTIAELWDEVERLDAERSFARYRQHARRPALHAGNRALSTGRYP